MDPGPGEAFILLRRFVSTLPIALCVPPQARECKAQPSRRQIAGKGAAKFLKIHTQQTKPVRSKPSSLSRLLTSNDSAKTSVQVRQHGGRVAAARIIQGYNRANLTGAE